MPDEEECKRDLNSFSPAGQLEETTDTSSYNVVVDLKSKNLCLNEAIDMAQTQPLCRDSGLRLALCTLSGACRKTRRPEHHNRIGHRALSTDWHLRWIAGVKFERHWRSLRRLPEQTFTSTATHARVRLYRSSKVHQLHSRKATSLRSLQ